MNKLLSNLKKESRTTPEPTQNAIESALDFLTSQMMPEPIKVITNDGTIELQWFLENDDDFICFCFPNGKRELIRFPKEILESTRENTHVSN